MRNAGILVKRRKTYYVVEVPTRTKLSETLPSSKGCICRMLCLKIPVDTPGKIS